MSINPITKIVHEKSEKVVEAFGKAVAPQIDAATSAITSQAAELFYKPAITASPVQTENNSLIELFQQIGIYDATKNIPLRNEFPSAKEEANYLYGYNQQAEKMRKWKLLEKMCLVFFGGLGLGAGAYTTYHIFFRRKA